MFSYDLIVIGAGHAGCEAALAGARLGLKTLIFTINLDNIAYMSCNPAVGGLAKGHLVREIDALGGEMAKIIDQTGLHFHMLNQSKGPAVWSPRAQADKLLYRQAMKKKLEEQKDLEVRQALVERIVVEDKKVRGVVTQTGIFYPASAVIVTPGTFLNGLIHIGLKSYPGGRGGEVASFKLALSLKELGFKLGRLKTGTSPRILSNTVDFSAMEKQIPDEDPQPFSYSTQKITQPQLPCFITHTNLHTHQIIRENLVHSPLYQGKIVGIGPRYCPSIETKIVRFPDRESHQIFLEPEGYQTQEMYVNGLSTSLPEEVQLEILHSIKGLESAQICRPGYAIEYDFVYPSQIKPNLETKLVENLFLAGQINGTSGYEEAAAQGLMAGINASLKIKKQPPFILSRDQAYIGVLIDDLITKEITEPYRMFTSRAEYRLILRQDNADLRLRDFGYRLGLVKKEDYEKFCEYREQLKEWQEKIKSKTIFLPSSSGKKNTSLAQLMKTPNVALKEIYRLEPELEKLPSALRTQLEISFKYEGYIERQRRQIERSKKLESKKIPPDFDYQKIKGLSEEAREKLEQIRPLSLGQAGRIAGVKAADLSLLMISLIKEKKLKKYSHPARN